MSTCSASGLLWPSLSPSVYGSLSICNSDSNCHFNACLDSLQLLGNNAKCEVRLYDRITNHCCPISDRFPFPFLMLHARLISIDLSVLGTH